MRSWIVAGYLLALGFGSLRLAQTAWDSVVGFRPGYALNADLPAAPAISRRVVLVVLDGVRVDAVERMPELSRIAAAGASGIAATVLPSLSNPARASLVTGADPEIHGVTTNGGFAPPTVDSLFSLAKARDMPIAVYGGSLWRRAFGEYLGESVVEFHKEQDAIDDPETLIAWQREICEAIVPAPAGVSRGLIVAGLTAADEAGHDFGGESDEYYAVIAEVDRCLGTLYDAWAGRGTTFVIISDHGHIQRRGQGGHGGAEPEVARVPLILAGAGVYPASGWNASQVDVAPTIAALLGLPLPALNQGQILWQALDPTPAVRSALERNEREQRRLRERELPDRAAGLARERAQRRPVAVGAAAWFFLVGLLTIAWAGPPRWRALLGLVVCLLSYKLFAGLFGIGETLSTIVREEHLNSFFARNIAAAALSLLVTLVVVPRPFVAALLATSAIGVRLAWAHASLGLVMQRFLPNLDRALVAYLDLLSIFAIGVTACVVALGAAGLRFLRERRMAEADVEGSEAEA